MPELGSEEETVVMVVLHRGQLARSCSIQGYVSHHTLRPPPHPPIL